MNCEMRNDAFGNHSNVTSKSKFALAFMSGKCAARESEFTITVNRPAIYCSFAYSTLACFRMGMSGSASFHAMKNAS